MPVLFRDIETRSAVNLTTVGAWRCAADPATEVLCVGYAVDDGAVQIWTPDQPIPEEFFTAARDPTWLTAAHNDQFESAIEERLLHPRYGWPLVPIERHRCTMAMAMASALPGGLDGAAAALGLQAGKDRDGRRLMLQMARPRRARRGEDPELTYWHDDADRRLRLAAYCKRDVELERELHQRLPPLSEPEQALWVLDAEVNARGFHVDLELAEAARSTVRAEQKAIDAEVAELTGGKVTSINQVARLTAVLRERGHEVAGLTKRSVAAVLAHDPPPDVRRLLELRQQGARAAARKLDSLIAGADADRRLRGTLKFHAASTGRWSGSRFQPHNLRRVENKDLGPAIDAVRGGDLARVRALGAPLAIVGDLSRSLIGAAPGHTLVGADFSAVESRVLAWLAGEKWKLEAHRKFDATGDPAGEPYCVLASRILKRPVTPADDLDRQIGKFCELAFGFGGGAGAFRNIVPADAAARFTDAQVEGLKNAWRRAHPATCDYWRRLHSALRRAVATREPVAFENLGAEMRGGDLRLRLPSGRELAYPGARLKARDMFEAPEIVYRDNARGAWAEVRGWHGTFVENVVQAIARDLLAAALQRLEVAGYPIVLHVHDEIVAEVAENFGSAEEFARIMSEPPSWATGLPLVAKGWSCACYGAKSAPKAQQSPIPPSPPIPSPSPSPSPAKLNTPRPAPIDEPLTDGKILCPFHDDERPSLHVYDDEDDPHFHCFACGAHGPLSDLPEGSWTPAAPGARARADDEATLAYAHRLWEQARPIAGTLAARYLAEVRGIDVDALPPDIDTALRFHAACPFNRTERRPCLLALFRDVETDEPAGIHRIALTPEAQKIGRRMLGRWPAPRAIKLWPATDRLFLGEGVETVLAAATRLLYRGAPMHPAWAAGSGGNIGKFPVIDADLTLLVDHDEQGEGCANQCRRRWRLAGRDVVRLRPDRPGTDFNDLVLERCKP